MHLPFLPIVPYYTGFDFWSLAISKPWVGEKWPGWNWIDGVGYSPDNLNGSQTFTQVVDANCRLLHIKQLLLVTAISMQIPNTKLAATFYHWLRIWFDCACQSPLKAVLQLPDMLTSHFYQPLRLVCACQSPLKPCSPTTSRLSTTVKCTVTVHMHA